MSNLTRLLALLVMTGSLVIINQMTVLADPCESSQFLEDCNAADDADWSACETYCFSHFGEHVQTHSGVCHWYGETNPGECLTQYPDSCGCFKNYTRSDCTCTGL